MRFRYGATLIAFLLPIVPACSGAEAPRSGAPAFSPAPTDPTPESSPSPTPAAVRFAAVADAGTGDRAQAAVVARMCRLHARDPYTDVVQAGDNVYDHGEPAAIEPHFAEPFACLLDRGVAFHSVLGNHDVDTDRGRAQLEDPRFGMPARNYTWSRGPVSFVMLDSTAPPDRGDLAWLDERLATAESSAWTVAVFHHPPFSPGTEHGSSLELRALFAGRFARSGVDLVISGHEHLYSRAKVRGVTYVVTGGGGRELTSCTEPLPKPYRTCRSVHEFLEFEVTEDRLVLTAHTAGGGTIETHEVARNP